MTGYRIAHLFADHGTESEVLSAFGHVSRFTINPRPSAFDDETVKMDLMAEMPSDRFDLAVLHPSCAPWAQTTSISGDPDDHENQIPRSREIANRIAEHYVIENKPRAPLEDPTILTGKMFGLPIAYERAFESSFPLRAPPRQQELPTDVSVYFYSDRTHEWWKAVKGYRGEYPKEHLVRNALPAAYVWCLVRSWFKTINERDAQEAQDNSSPPPRELAPNQAKLPDGGFLELVQKRGDDSC